MEEGGQHREEHREEEDGERVKRRREKETARRSDFPCPKGLGYLPGIGNRMTHGTSEHLIGISDL